MAAALAPTSAGTSRWSLSAGKRGRLEPNPIKRSLSGAKASHQDGKKANSNNSNKNLKTKLGGFSDGPVVKSPLSVQRARVQSLVTKKEKKVSGRAQVWLRPRANTVSCLPPGHLAGSGSPKQGLPGSAGSRRHGSCNCFLPWPYPPPLALLGIALGQVSP